MPRRTLCFRFSFSSFCRCSRQRLPSTAFHASSFSYCMRIRSGLMSSHKRPPPAGFLLVAFRPASPSPRSCLRRKSRPRRRPLKTGHAHIRLVQFPRLLSLRPRHVSPLLVLKRFLPRPLLHPTRPRVREARCDRHLHALAVENEDLSLVFLLVPREKFFSARKQQPGELSCGGSCFAMTHKTSPRRRGGEKRKQRQVPCAKKGMQKIRLTFLLRRAGPTRENTAEGKKTEAHCVARSVCTPQWAGTCYLGCRSSPGHSRNRFRSRDCHPFRATMRT